jgi:hypothetical protein
MRMLATRANRQPAAATYIHIPGEPAYRAFSLSVVTINDGLLTDLAQFGPNSSLPSDPPTPCHATPADAAASPDPHSRSTRQSSRW